MPLVRKNFVPVDIRPVPPGRSIIWLEAGGDPSHKMELAATDSLGEESIVFSDVLGGDTFEFNTSDAERVMSFVAFNSGTSAELVSFLFSNTGTQAVGDKAYVSFRLSASGIGDVPQEFARFGVEATEMETPGTDSGAATISALDADTMTEFLKIDPFADLIQLDLPLDVKNRGGDLGHITSSGVITSNRPPGGTPSTPLVAMIATEGGLNIRKLSDSGIYGQARIIGEPSGGGRTFQVRNPTTLGSLLLTSVTHPTSPNQCSLTGYNDVIFGGLGGIPQNIQLGTGAGGDEVSVIENLAVGSAISDPSVILKVAKTVVPRAVQDPIMTVKERNAITTLGLDNDANGLANDPNAGGAAEVLSVIDKDLTAPPGGESAGDAYIVASVATGAWTGQEDNVAVFNGATWDFITSANGDILDVVDESIRYELVAGVWTATHAKITSVIDKDLTAPPGGESVGDRYIVGIGATGDWASQDNDVAVVDSITPTVWSFVTVSEGDLLVVTDESKRYRFLNMAWKETKQEALRVYCDVDNGTDLNAVKQWFGFNGSAWVILG